MAKRWLILLNFNLTELCIQRLGELANCQDLGFFIVDNASDAGEYETLREFCQANGFAVVEGADWQAALPAVKQGKTGILLRLAENLGYGAGNNAGLRALQASIGVEGRYVIMNPDVRIEPRVLDALLDSADDISGPAVFEGYLGKVSEFPHWFDLRIGFETARTRSEGVIRCLSGCCLKFSGGAIDRFGYLPDDLFLYDEEMRFFERVWRLGGRPVFRSDLVVHHNGSASIGKQSFTYFYYIFRNRMLYLREVAWPHYGTYFRSTFTYLRWAAAVVRSTARRGNWTGARAVILGAFHGLLGRHGPIHKPTRRAD